MQPLPLGSDDSSLKSAGNGLLTIRGAELAADRVKVMLDRTRADRQSGGDVVAGEATRRHRQTFTFAVAETGTLQMRRYQRVERAAHEELMEVALEHQNVPHMLRDHQSTHLIEYRYVAT